VSDLEDEPEFRANSLERREAELQKMLSDISAISMNGDRCADYGGVASSKHIDYVKGANIARFKNSLTRC
jgi:hypothetical protein